MMFRKLVFFNIVFLAFFISQGAYAANFLETVELFQAGKFREAKESCIEIISTSTEYSDMLASAYAINALAETLDANAEEARTKCSSLYDLLEGYKEGNQDNKQIDYALAIIAYLAGRKTEAELDGSLKESETEWKGTALVAKYLVAARNNAEDEVLEKISSEYYNLLSGFSTDNWATAFYPRLKIWQKWICYGDGSKESLEYLVANVNLEERKKRKLDKQNEKYFIISGIIETYTRNKIAEGRAAAQKAIEDFASRNDDSLKPFIAVLGILAEKEAPDFQATYNKARADTSLWSLACVAFFVKYTASEQKPQRIIFLNCLDNFNKNCQIGEMNPAVEKWKERMALWEKWCEDDFPKMDGLEPLFLANCRGSKPAQAQAGSAQEGPATPAGPPADNSALIQQLAEITDDDYKALREGKYQNRPRPYGLVFDEAKVKAYILSLPEDIRKIELDRFNKINKVRDYLVRILERNPFPKGVKTKNGGFVSGTVTMANENYLVVRRGSKKGKPKRCEWDELSVEQFEAFLSHYAAQKMSSFGGQVSKEEGTKNAAQDFVLIAMIYDWYGRYKEALKYGRKAVSIDPSIESPVAEMLLK